MDFLELSDYIGYVRMVLPIPPKYPVIYCMTTRT